MRYNKTNNKMTNILLIGDARSGKSMWLRRLMHKSFSETYLATHGKDTEVIMFDNRKVIIHDIGCVERLQSQIDLYYNIADGAMIFYDISNKDATITPWIKRVDNIPYRVVGNKRDRVSDYDRVAISCKDDERVDAVLIDLLLEIPSPRVTSAPPTFLDYILDWMSYYIPLPLFSRSPTA